MTMVSSNSKAISIKESSTNIMALQCKNTFSTSSGQGTVKYDMDFTSDKSDVEATEKQQT